jgi:S1-C subfamily serine protease
MLTITREELAAAEPLPSRPASASGDAGESGGKRSGPRWNRVAVAAFILALIGIPLFGLVTGLIAMVVGCIALTGHSYGRKGVALAVAAIVIGLFEVIGWAAGLYAYMGASHMMVSLDQLTIDPESLNALPERIARAMRANVVVQSGAGLGRQGIGSGVILKIRDGLAQIVTNRHMVDFNYSDDTRTIPQDLSSLKNIRVLTVGEELVPAKVEWLAPNGVDLAIISAPILSNKVEEAHWDHDITPHIGDQVFAVGNPQGLGWTHSAGDISQVRRQTHNDYSFRVLQTTAAINPGNSGGGLYDSDGRLIGINTMTSDKRFAEGLSFSIAFPTLLELAPDRLEIPRKNPESKNKKK